MFPSALHGVGYHFNFLETEWFFSSYKEEKHLLLIMKA